MSEKKMSLEQATKIFEKNASEALQEKVSKMENKEKAEKEIRSFAASWQKPGDILMRDNYADLTFKGCAKLAACAVAGFAAYEGLKIGGRRVYSWYKARKEVKEVTNVMPMPRKTAVNG